MIEILKKLGGDKKMRKIWKTFGPILIASILLLSIASTATAYKETGTVVVQPDGTCKFETKKEITSEQLIGGAIAIVIIIKAFTGCPGTFTDISGPPGWTYETDGETYLKWIPPSPITEPGTFGQFYFTSTHPACDFEWETYGVDGQLLETGTLDVTGDPECIPEFTIIALPIIALFGLLFLFSRRKRKE